ncbi:hypothetical protein Y1Q_0016590 [Alligator mississippiensis]|uniref:Uncharacterized protein n=1 Tax=Alligator mississippiensis TaxID=8496 RepID=A0A151MJS0_ALLMI|nr:hypothetical protein Y1Q_0016590 [Alligator mississippiensis]
MEIHALEPEAQLRSQPPQWESFAQFQSLCKEGDAAKILAFQLRVKGLNPCPCASWKVHVAVLITCIQPYVAYPRLQEASLTCHLIFWSTCRCTYFSRKFHTILRIKSEARTRLTSAFWKTAIVLTTAVGSA